jgi:hypothetical protein
VLFKCESVAEALEAQDVTGQDPLDWATARGNSEALIILQEVMYG